MSNNPTPPRIEREAEKFGFQVPYNGTNEFYNKDRLEGFKAGATAEHNRAAPVVKALEDRLKEWEASQKMERMTVDLINETAKTGMQYVKLAYPDEPTWVIQYKQLLQTYKADV